MGILTVKLLSASNLSRKDLFSKSDPFCELRLAGQVQKSRTVHNSQNPYWGDSFTFHVTNPLSESLVVNLFDYDILSRNDQLGYCVIPLNTLVQGQPLLRTYQLLGAKKGSLTLELTAQDFGGHTVMVQQPYVATQVYAAPQAYVPPPQPYVHHPPATYAPPPQPTYHQPYAPQPMYPSPQSYGAPPPAHIDPFAPPPVQGYPPAAYGTYPPVHGYPPYPPHQPYP